MKAIVLLIVMVSPTMTFTHPFQRKMASNAMDRVNRFDELLMREYTKNGVNGIAMYFDANFEYREFEGPVMNKREYLEHLRGAKKSVKHIFVAGDFNKVAYFRPGRHGPQDLLVVSYYTGHVNVVLTLIEDNSLRAGYRFLSIKPASA